MDHNKRLCEPKNESECVENMDLVDLNKPIAGSRVNENADRNEILGTNLVEDEPAKESCETKANVDHRPKISYLLDRDV